MSYEPESDGTIPAMPWYVFRMGIYLRTDFAGC